MTRRTRTPKSFDCVAFKRRAQAEIYDQIKDRSPQAQIDYFRRRAAESALGDWWELVKKPPEVASPPAQ